MAAMKWRNGRRSPVDIPDGISTTAGRSWRITILSPRFLCILLLCLCKCSLGQDIDGLAVSDGANIEVIQRVVETYFSPLSSYGYYTPCAYPVPSDPDFQRRCFISDRSYEQNFMCNLDGAISNTEMDALVAHLNKTFSLKRGLCECGPVQPRMVGTSSPMPTDEFIQTRMPPFRRINATRSPKKRETKPRLRPSWSPPSHTPGHVCWYKIALAFISNLPMPTLPVQHHMGYKELCNSTVVRNGQSNNGPWKQHRTRKESNPFLWTPKAVRRYGEKFAQVVRERWNIGQCGEDILFLVVVRRPDVLGEAEENKTGPVIFASLGHSVADRTGHLTIDKRPSLQYLVEDFNQQLANQDRTKLKYYLSGLLDQFYMTLSLADQTNVKPSAIRNFASDEAARLRNKQHIPDWAMAAFGGCALLLIVMGLGYCLVKSRVRRGGVSRPKPGADGGRRWKAGFVGALLRAGTMWHPTTGAGSRAGSTTQHI